MRKQNPPETAVWGFQPEGLCNYVCVLFSYAQTRSASHKCLIRFDSIAGKTPPVCVLANVHTHTHQQHTRFMPTCCAWKLLGASIGPRVPCLSFRRANRSGTHTYGVPLGKGFGFPSWYTHSATALLLHDSWDFGFAGRKRGFLLIALRYSKQTTRLPCEGRRRWDCFSSWLACILYLIFVRLFSTDKTTTTDNHGASIQCYRTGISGSNRFGSLWLKPRSQLER